MHIPQIRLRFKFLLIKLLIAFAVIGGLLWYLELELIYQSARALNPLFIFYLFVFSLAGVAIQAEKWHLLLVHCAPDSRRLDALYSLLIGFGLGLFTPGRIGELGRGLALQGDLKTISIFTAADRLVSMLITFFVGIGALFWLRYGNVFLVLGVFSSSLVVVGVAIRFLVLVRLNASSGKWAQALSVLQPVPVQSWVYLILWSCLFNLVFFSQFFLLVGDFYGWTMQVALAVPALFALKSILPISFLDIGIREGVAVAVYSQLGYDPLPAFNASLLLFLFNVVLPGIVGWFLWSRRDGDRVFNLGWRKV